MLQAFFLILEAAVRVELTNCGFAELKRHSTLNKISRLSKFGCGNFAPFRTLYATICKDLQR